LGVILSVGCASVDELAAGNAKIAYMPSVQEQLSGLDALAAIRQAIDTKQVQITSCESPQVSGLTWNCLGKSATRWAGQPVVSIVQNGNRYDICLRTYASESCSGRLWATICSAVDARGGCRFTDPSGAPAARRAVDGILVLAVKRTPLLPEQDALFQAAARRVLDAPPADPAAQEEDRKRTQVKLEAFIKNNAAVQAARDYSAYLANDPLWADGHLNLAVVLASLELYPEAIAAARKYLYLDPDGKDSRSAKDQIYQWEALLAVRGQ
jgi:hypothetical protein